MKLIVICENADLVRQISELKGVTSVHTEGDRLVFENCPHGVPLDKRCSRCSERYAALGQH